VNVFKMTFSKEQRSSLRMILGIETCRSDFKCFNVKFYIMHLLVNPLKPSDTYRGRTAPLTSKRCILYIYSANIDTAYFKHGI